MPRQPDWVGLMKFVTDGKNDYDKTDPPWDSEDIKSRLIRYCSIMYRYREHNTAYSRNDALLRVIFIKFGITYRQLGNTIIHVNLTERTIV